MTDPLLGGSGDKQVIRDPLVAPEDRRVSAQQVTDLAQEVTGLSKAATLLARRTGRNETTVRLAIVGLAIDVLLSIGALFLVHSYATQNAQLKGSIHEQCSLYGLLIPSYRETSKATSPLGPQGYDDAFRKIQISADNLGCGIPHKVPGS